MTWRGLAWSFTAARRSVSRTTDMGTSHTVQYTTFPLHKYSRGLQREPTASRKWEHVTLQPLLCRVAVHAPVDTRVPRRLCMTVEWEPSTAHGTPTSLVLVRPRPDRQESIDIGGEGTYAPSEVCVAFHGTRLGFKYLGAAQVRG